MNRTVNKIIQKVDRLLNGKTVSAHHQHIHWHLTNTERIFKQDLITKDCFWHLHSIFCLVNLSRRIAKQWSVGRACIFHEYTNLTPADRD